MQGHRSTSPPLLKFYVLAASALAHLLLLPAWAAWLGLSEPEPVPPLEPPCGKQAAASFDEADCETQRCPVERQPSLKVALLEQVLPKEPPEPLPEQFVLTPQDAEPSPVPPKDARFAGRVDTSTEHETAARSDRPSATLVAAPSQPRPELSPRQRRAAAEASAAAIEVPQLDPNAAKPRPEQAEATTPETPNELLLPNFDAELLAALSEGGGTVDYLKDVDDGERTLLNRKRVAYSDFFERVMLAISAEWDPGIIYRRRDPTGRIYGVQDRVTVLYITLSGDGKLHEVYVDSPSGLDFLDDEAVRALREASPFPNPPEGIKGLDGRLQFRCAFHFEISTRKTRVFRYR